MKLHITERALEDIAAPQKGRKLLVFDTEQNGFAVHVTANGTKSYVIVYRDADGSQRQEKLAGVGDIAAHAARELAKARLQTISEAKAADGHKPTSAAEAKSVGMTLDGKRPANPSCRFAQAQSLGFQRCGSNCPIRL